MNHFQVLALLFDPSFILRARGLNPDPWQKQILLSADRQNLLNCSRQSGKSTTVAALALHTALSRPGSLILLLSPSLRQSMELFRKVIECNAAIGQPIETLVLNQTRLELKTHSRIVCLPGKEETIRSFSGVDLLVIDEAARVPDDLYRAVRPMLAVSRGRLVCLSTPFGKRGFFHEEWEHGGDAWQRIRITWKDCLRICPDFIEMERRSMGDSWVRQEYECSFEALEGLVYPDFEALCAVDAVPFSLNPAPTLAPVSLRPSASSAVISSLKVTAESAEKRREAGTEGRQVGGIDFGFRNPFCALWGVLDRDDVLWICQERYLRETGIHEHATALTNQAPGVMWYADPAGPTEIEELRRAGLKVLRGGNAIQAGIAAVDARLRTGRLRVLRSACPNLLAEAKLYRYPSSSSGHADTEVPLDQNNHALAALRYLVSRLDTGFVARFRRRNGDQGNIEQEAGGSQMKIESCNSRKTMRLNNEELWTVCDT
jgi:hypothetical protein